MKKHNILVTVNGVSKSRAQWAKELGVTRGAISFRESKGESASSAIENIIGTTHSRKVLEHYAHAKEKHPYFCDYIIPDFFDGKQSAEELAEFRGILKSRVLAKHVCFLHVLRCEIAEARDALANGDTAAAVEEFYDAVAVLLRTIDVLEGRQKLGKPEKGEGK